MPKRVQFSLPEKKEEPKKQLSYLQRIHLRNVLRTKDMFLSSYGTPIDSPLDVIKGRVALKANMEYAQFEDVAKVAPRTKRSKRKADPDGRKTKKRQLVGVNEENLGNDEDLGTLAAEVTVTPTATEVGGPKETNALAHYGRSVPASWFKPNAGGSLVLHRPAKPLWHPPWKVMKVLSGHQGWVRCVDVDVSNEFFVTGSADRTIKIWDLASGDLKLTLTGHTDHVRGVKISPRHPYLFTVGLDQTVKCWDLTMNKVIRNYHGHLSGVFCVDIHPALEVIMTGGRDSTCRVWDIRTKQQIHCLAGHKNTVCSVAAQVGKPELITGSHDNTLRCWDLAAGRASSILTHHKKSVRSLCVHPVEYTFASGSGDNIKVWKCPEGRFLRNFMKSPPSICNALAINDDNVVCSGHDTGQLLFWDWKTGHCFQETFSTPQAGSIEPDAGIQACTFDRTGTRLITVETDKSIKIWKQDETATPDTHPLKFKPGKRKLARIY